MPFTLFWAGFTVLWNVMVWRGHAPVFFRIWGIPFLLAGVYAVIGRFFLNRKRKQRLEYALMAARAVILDSRGIVREVPLIYVPIEQNRSRDGRHLTVTFGVAAASGFGFGRGRMPTNSGLDLLTANSAAPTFVDVEDVAGLTAALAQITRR